MPVFLRRRFDHLTPRYVFDRATLWAYSAAHQDEPWLTPRAIALLRDVLRRQDRGLEWGSGRSTAWFAARTAHVISVESSPAWYDRVSRTLSGGGVHNVDYRFVADAA